jgi:hypothetical protein
MKKKNTGTNVTTKAIIVAIFISVLTGIFAFQYKLDYSQIIATAGLLFAVAAFAGVLFNLNATYIQLQKAMAKPILSLAFSEDGKTEATIIASKDGAKSRNLEMWIINKGNAVTKMFQIELEIPNILRPNFETPSYTELPLLNSKLSLDKKATIFSFFSKEKVYCFVNLPVQIHPLKLHSQPEDFEEFQSEYKLRYRVYGDWAKTQEDELKITISKQ